MLFFSHSDPQSILSCFCFQPVSHTILTCSEWYYVEWTYFACWKCYWIVFSFLYISLLIASILLFHQCLRKQGVCAPDTSASICISALFFFMFWFAAGDLCWTSRSIDRTVILIHQQQQKKTLLFTSMISIVDKKKNHPVPSDLFLFITNSDKGGGEERNSSTITII